MSKRYLASIEIVNARTTDDQSIKFSIRDTKVQIAEKLYDTTESVQSFIYIFYEKLFESTKL